MWDVYCVNFLTKKEASLNENHKNKAAVKMFAPRNSSPPMKCYLTNNDYVAAYQVNLNILLRPQKLQVYQHADNDLYQYRQIVCYVTHKWCRHILRIFFDHTHIKYCVCDTNERDNNKSKNERETSDVIRHDKFTNEKWELCGVEMKRSFWHFINFRERRKK